MMTVNCLTLCTIDSGRQTARFYMLLRSAPITESMGARAEEKLPPRSRERFTLTWQENKAMPNWLEKRGREEERKEDSMSGTSTRRAQLSWLWSSCGTSGGDSLWQHRSEAVYFVQLLLHTYLFSVIGTISCKETVAMVSEPIKL